MSDIDTALRFVVAQIEEEAARSGEPLNEDERLLLLDLPTDPVLPQMYNSPAELGIRDFAYEKLCALAKAAHEDDLRQNPNSSLDWEFAACVAKLERHPVSWLLDWAGVRHRKPWWDRWVLITAAVLVVLVGGTLMFVIGNEPLAKPVWITVAMGCAATLVLLFLAARRIEDWQLRHNIERCQRSIKLAHPGEFSSPNPDSGG